MSTDRIAQLHEQASEHYLNGAYADALQAWRDVLALDPKNEPALDGVRMAAQFVERSEAEPAHPELEHELEQGLSVLNNLGRPAQARAAPPAAAPSRDPNATMILNRAEIDALIDLEPAPAAAVDPNRQGDGIDFGDLSSVAAIPLGAAAEGAVDQAPPAGWEPPAPPAEAEVGLEPATAAQAADSAAAVELKRRVDDLLLQARAKAEAGESDEALAILHRLGILDEDNADAAALRTSLETSATSDLDTIERSIVEGVGALEADHLDDAERCFSAALAIAPEHREALHYMETVKKRRAELAGAPAARHDELLGGGDLLGDLPPVDPGAPAPVQAVPLAAPERAAGKAPKTPRPAPMPEPLAAPEARRAILPSSRVMILVGGAAALLIGGVLAWPHLMGRSHAKPAPPLPPPRPAAAKPLASASTTPQGGLAVLPASPEDRAKAVAAGIAEGRRQISAGDFAAAVISFNEAVTLDPANVEAKAGFQEAGDKYKAKKAEQDALNGIKLAFRDGEYTSALRLAYRLPASVGAPTVDGIKVAGWYNLAIVALRAGDCREAQGHLDEVLTIAPADPEAKRLKEFAKLYAESAKDRKFLDFVEALQFRTPSL